MKKHSVYMFLMFLIAVFVFVNTSLAGEIRAGMRVGGFVLRDIEGNRRSLNSLLADNKPHVFSFFATWCKPCLKEIPKLQELKAKTGVNITLISIDAITREALKEFLKKNSIKLPVLLDPDAAVTGEN